MARTIPVEERLFSLVLALLATEHGLTKHEILSTVTGYAARYATDRDRGSLERQFERDKEELRDLGVPLETFDAQGAENDTKFQRYRIPADRYQLPDEVRFTPDQYALLGLAAQVWREGSLSQDSRRALTKLRSLGLALDDAIIGMAPTIRTRDAAHEPLTLAIDRGQQVTFRYLKPGRTAPELRRVSPLALVHHEGRWHLQAHDDAADAPRTFLLRRIVGQVSVAGAATRRPAAEAARPTSCCATAPRPACSGNPSRSARPTSTSSPTSSPPSAPTSWSWSLRPCATRWTRAGRRSWSVMAKRAPAPKAGDKLTFLLALVPYLIDQVRVSVDEAAAHFGVPP